MIAAAIQNHGEVKSRMAYEPIAASICRRCDDWNYAGILTAIRRAGFRTLLTSIPPRLVSWTPELV
jgi:hypothetical protein